MLLKSLTSEQIAWLAGLLDGEGNVITFTRPKYKNRILRVSITNTNIELLSRVKEWTGIGFIAGHTDNNPKHKIRYNWIIGGANAREFLRLLSPWLIVKRDIAHEVMDEVPAHWKIAG